MTRMSREFSLVLLGAGVLTAGYFVNREDNDLFAKEEDQARKQVSSSRHHGSSGGMIFLHGGGYAGGKSSSRASASGVARRGFGGMSAHFGGGG
jgi:hypothetical protein